MRTHGVTEQTLYRWKTKYGGMHANETKRLKALEEENRQLKRLVADQALNRLVGKTVVTSEQRRTAVTSAMESAAPTPSPARGTSRKET